MTGIKQSNFTQVTSVSESDNIPLFTASENKRITYENMRNQLTDEIAVRFIYPTTAQLQQSNLEADEDEPNYVRCEETEYRLYKITALAAEVDDIVLDNGMTATYQEEYSKSGFVLGAASSTNNAIALFDGTTGAQLKTGAVLSTIGGNLASATSIAQVSYPRVDAANAVTMATPTILKTDLNLPSNTAVSISNIESDISAIEGDITAIEGDIVDINSDLATKVQTVETFADLATTPAPTAGMVVYLKQHTSGGIGGGSFITKAGVTTSDSGSISLSATAGFYFERIDPKKTPYEFGYVDGSDDVSVAVNACIAAYGDCFLDGGKTYDIQYTINNPQRLYGIGGVATLNCTSPTANTRFGGALAAVYALGGVGDPLTGVDIQNIKIECNELIIAVGSTGLKGFVFQRCENFYQRNCTVVSCASYAFWDYDVATTGTTHCSGTRDDCIAIDCAVSYEQVNVRGVTLNNCNGYISSASLSYVPECIYHAYGGDDMQIVYNNCIGIADGVCPAVFLGLLEIVNLTMNDCIFRNNYDNGASIQTAVFFDGSGTSNFDKINFNNCEFESSFSTAVTLSDGSASTADNSINFLSCKILGYQVGVQLNVSQGRYYFTDCDVRGFASLAVTPFALYNNGTPTEVKVIGGYFKASTSGSGTPTVTNLSTGIFTSTTLSPSTASTPRIRQKVVGITTWGGDGSTYSNINITFPSACLNWTSISSHACKVSGFAQVDYGLSLAADLPAAVAMAHPVVGAMIANDTYRFVGHPSLKDKTVHYEVTEYE